MSEGLNLDSGGAEMAYWWQRQTTDERGNNHLLFGRTDTPDTPTQRNHGHLVTGPGGDLVYLRDEQGHEVGPSGAPADGGDKPAT